MGRKYLKLNNQGSTLLTVIICIAFVGILGSMMLSVTKTNLQMKIIESKSKQNFYSCEVAMEEIRTGIEEITAAKIQEVYETKVLGNFADFLLRQPTALAKNTYIKQQISAAVIRKIGNADSIADDAPLYSGTAVKERRDDFFNNYLSTPPAGAAITVTIGRDDTHLPISSDGNSVTIEDICVRMTKNDYETSITTDIVITLPDFTFDEVVETEEAVYTLEQPFQNYALVADGLILSDQTLNANNINGNVYAGTGITADGRNSQNHVLNITANQVVTRGTIKAEDTGKLVIKGPVSGGDTKPAVVWANNLMTNTTSNSVALTTALDIYGICFIKDDFTLEGSKSNVKLKGAYVGYSGAHTALGSSIIINGTGSTMNLSELDSLILVGRANISPDGAAITEDIMTGESIAFKSNQRAYLIPGKFIDQVKRNPITTSDIGPSGLPRVDFSLEASSIPYVDYVDPTHSYKIASKLTKPTDPNSLLRYYYLSFASGKKADKYLQEYMIQYPTALNIMDPFELGVVSLPDASVSTKEVLTVGNRMSYNGTAVNLEPGMSNRPEPEFQTDSLLDAWIGSRLLNHQIYTAKAGLPSYKVSMLPGLYSKVSHLLSLDSTRTYQETDSTVGALLNPSGIGVVAGDTNVRYFDGNKVLNSGDISATDNLVVVNGSVTINTDFQGLLLASGNITINSDVEINGMAIAVGSSSGGTADITLLNQVTVNGCLAATGNITLGNQSTINAGTDSFIEYLFTDNVKVNTLRNLFKNATMTINYTSGTAVDERTVDLSAMISYENWQKN